ncbi:MAG: DUF1553 domain-containing protein, partial [Verrucomicrobiota bacterium]
EEIDAFVSDRSPNAFEKVVDRLLSSPRYAERMTWQWLEAARYADTDGYQNDGPREMWRWRDWVIDAYAANMPYDQFTIEQLAGDLLPSATIGQRIATGFNRNHRYNSESGLVLEEFLLENAVDRVDTTSTVWMGVTMGCARCHDHKYDPFSQKEYYQLVSFFDAVPESGRAIKYGNSEPWIKAPTAAQNEKLAALDRELSEAKEVLSGFSDDMEAELEVDDVLYDKPIVSDSLAHHFAKDEVVNADGSTEVIFGEKIGGTGCHERFSIALRINPDQVEEGAVFSTEQQNSRRAGVFLRYRKGHLQFAIVSRWIAGVGMIETVDTFEPGREVHVTLTNDGTQRAQGMKIYVDGVPAATRTVYNTNSNTGGSGGAVRIGGWGKHQKPWTGEVADLRVYRSRTLTEGEARLIAKGTDERRYRLEHGGFSKEIGEAWQRVETLTRKRERYLDSIQTTMVMEEGEKEIPTLIRVRGEYHNHGEPVESDVPRVFPGLDDDFPRNRLGFARWLVRGDHPLTARVAVNRYWQMLFGTGLVKTAEDFGTQGSLPTHPELLDWLACEFVESGWDVRELLKTIVMSRTYRQSSVVTPALREKDPENRWLARAPRLKLHGNVLRDQALFVSTLLVEKKGGISVKPYQPANMWKEASNFKYQQGKGDDLYRRSLYTYWKRTLAPPSMAVLDTADREWCSVKPKRTNTPLQALTLMNETAFFEAARKLGERIVRMGGSEARHRIDYAFRSVLARSPSDREREILERAWEDYTAAFAENPEQVREMQMVGDSPAEKGDLVALGAATALANTLFNLEEASVRE